jgi:hypothetical protein
VSAIECVFFINIVKTISIQDTLASLDLKAFDYWRLLNSFIRFDPQMPRTLSTHFREIEIKIVTEIAWVIDSPVSETVKRICHCTVDPYSSHDLSPKVSYAEDKLL